MSGPHPLKRPPPTSDLNNQGTSSRHTWKASSTRLEASLFRFAASLNSWLSVTTPWAFHQPPLPAEFSPEALQQTKRNIPKTKHHKTRQWRNETPSLYQTETEETSMRFRPLLLKVQTHWPCLSLQDKSALNLMPLCHQHQPATSPAPGKMIYPPMPPSRCRSNYLN